MDEPKITKSDILEKTEGMLQKQLYVVNTMPVDGMGPVMQALKPHLEFLMELEPKGILFAAGPFWEEDEETWNGEGMVILRADSLSEAREIAASDPMHSSGARRFIVRPWLLNEGGFNLKLSFSNGAYSLD